LYTEAELMKMARFMSLFHGD